ncbi:MAG: endonuclease/exonuclease/phosphatase family protein [Granulosicoccus sp.]|nr:endonuclease/exonuclease/phosphatase family protein [Granulosicoccus sp.]
MNLRIVSWNILQGGGSRISGICKAIAQLQPDILILQEFRNGKHLAALSDAIDKLELHHRYFPETPSAQNSVALVSRYSFELLDWPGVGSGAPSQSVKENLMFAALINCETGQATTKSGFDFSEFTLIGAHFPHKKAQQPYFDVLLNDQSLLQSPAMVIGDLNCGIPLVDSDTKTFANTHLFQGLLQQGWVDSWRSRHSDDREFSWISPRGNGYRYDHCLTSQSLDVHIKEIFLDHSVREQELSDHSALVVQF